MSYFFYNIIQTTEKNQPLLRNLTRLGVDLYLLGTSLRVEFCFRGFEKDRVIVSTRLFNKNSSGFKLLKSFIAEIKFMNEI